MGCHLDHMHAAGTLTFRRSALYKRSHSHPPEQQLPEGHIHLRAAMGTVLTLALPEEPQLVLCRKWDEGVDCGLLSRSACLEQGRQSLVDLLYRERAPGQHGAEKPPQQGFWAEGAVMQFSAHPTHSAPSAALAVHFLSRFRALAPRKRSVASASRGIPRCSCPVVTGKDFLESVEEVRLQPRLHTEGITQSVLTNGSSEDPPVPWQTAAPLIWLSCPS